MFQQHKRQILQVALLPIERITCPSLLVAVYFRYCSFNGVAVLAEYAKMNALPEDFSLKNDKSPANSTAWVKRRARTYSNG